MFETVSVKDIKIRIGQLIKKLRKKERLSQQQLGEKLGLSRITIQNLESGHNATLDTVLKALQYFDILKSLDLFLANETNNSNYESLY